MARLNTFPAMAQAAAERLDAAKAQGEQLALLADAVPETAKVGRGKGKATSQLREWLAHRGFRAPEDQLAELAGLTTGQDPVTAAMMTAERVATWAFADRVRKTKGGDLVPVHPTPDQMIRLFELAYGVQLRAADALLPYGLAKVTPDVAPPAPTPIVIVGQPTAAAVAGSGERPMLDVTPVPARRMMPADLRMRIEQNQAVSGAADGATDGRSRTDGASA